MCLASCFLESSVYLVSRISISIAGRVACQSGVGVSVVCV